MRLKVAPQILIVLFVATATTISAGLWCSMPRVVAQPVSVQQKSEIPQGLPVLPASGKVEQVAFLDPPKDLQGKNPSPVPKDPAYVLLPAEVKAGVGRLVKLTATTNGKTVKWAIASDAADLIVSESGAWAIFSSPVSGKFLILAWTAQGDVPSEAARCWIIVGDPGPVPPDPGPGPGPGPGPTPGPAPIPVAGLRVLIVFETAEATKMPPAQQSILYGQTMRDWLNAKCVVGPDGKTKEFRIYDKDVAMGGESKLWQDAMKRPRTAVPWLLVSNGSKGGWEGPLPATVADTMAIVQKYAD